MTSELEWRRHVRQVRYNAYVFDQAIDDGASVQEAMTLHRKETLNGGEIWDVPDGWKPPEGEWPYEMKQADKL